jgi:DNA-binding GntR family transcriptional regulator
LSDVRPPSATEPTRFIHRRAWEAVHDYLRQRILSGELTPGTRLIEMTIAAELGLSQGPVREALARLERQGLVEAVPRRGRYVASVSVDRAGLLYELRARVEPLAATLAMEHLTDSDVELLTQLVRRIGSSGVTTAARVEADVAFHRRIYELADFPTLLGIWEQTEVITRRLAMSRPVAEHKTTQAVHAAILEALVSRDAARVEAAVEGHMQQTWALLGSRPNLASRLEARAPLEGPAESDESSMDGAPRQARVGSR